MKIVETDNWVSCDPNERFVTLPTLDMEQASKLCVALNETLSGKDAIRRWMIVRDDYKLNDNKEKK